MSTKLTKKAAATLIEVLDAQSGKARIADPEVYKAKKAEVAQYLDTEKGGVTKEVYEANKDNEALVASAKAHVAAKKDRDSKPKAAAKAPEDKTRTPEQEEASAKKIVAYFNAKTGKAPIADKKEFLDVEISTRNYRDRENGGLTEKAYERFKGFDGVKEASKAHKKWFKAKKAEKDLEPGA